MAMSPAAAARRSLAGATILQLVPALRDDPAGHAAVDIALALLQSGARAIIAGEGGPLVGELRAFGGEWLPMPNATFNPLRIRGNARRLANLIASERIDIVHAHSAGAAWSAFAATHRMPVFLVTSFPDRLPADSWPGTLFGRSLARGDRVAALRRVWGILPQIRLVLVPGRIAPCNGQLSMIDAARLLVGGGDRNIAFVFAGEDRGQARYARSVRRQARMHGIDMLCRMVGHCADMPAALAVAYVVAVSALEPPLSGHAAAEAQAMGRPVVATTVGVLPENVLCPPRMRDDLRTGWLVRPGNVSELARAVASVLALDVTAYAALSARARQFAEFVFSPHSVAEAIRGVYTSLLARDV